VYLDRYSGTPPFTVTPLQGIQSKAGSGVGVRFSADGEEAAQLARTSDAAIVVVGNRPACNKRTDTSACPDATEGMETIDRKEINLTQEQEKLIQDVYAANPRTIVVLVSSFPYSIDWEKEHISAIVHMANNSEEEGYALADVLFGDYNPAGRLTATWPESISQLPPMMDYNLRDGRTYMYLRDKPLFPFGFGLSYTTFTYSELHTSSSNISAGQQMEVSLRVKNAGQLSGDEVVQMYVKHTGSKVSRPELELKGFKRVHVPAGQTTVVEMPLTASSLMYWDDSQGKWRLERDTVTVMIGSSSEDIRLSKVITVQ
jgi:beta-glucosidase